jgi:hypothetical protein
LIFAALAILHRRKQKMRINIYAEEITDQVDVVEKKSDTGNTYYGIRFLLHSSDRLHFTTADDDRSAITFWIPGSRLGGLEKTDLKKAFQSAMSHLWNI